MKGIIVVTGASSGCPAALFRLAASTGEVIRAHAEKRPTRCWSKWNRILECQ